MRRWLTCLSIALNALFATACLALAVEAPRLLRVWLIDPERARRLAFFDEFPITPGDVVFLGDSLVEQAEWQELFPGVPVKNRGIAGDTVALVRERLPQITRGKPAKLFVAIGTNDVSLGRSPEAIAGDVAVLLREASEQTPGTELYLQSVLPRTPSQRVAIESLNVMLRTLSPLVGARFVDLQSLFTAPDGTLRKDLTNDGLHLLGHGYRIWRDRLLPLVNLPPPS
jgi:lysophospholipase L1-like esterase